MRRWEATVKDKAPEQVTGVENVCIAFELIQRAELHEMNDAAILRRSEQDMIDNALGQEIPLLKRLEHREKSIESLTLNLSDGREALNSLLVAGPETVSKMRQDIALARGKLLQAQQHIPQGGLAWLRDGLTQGTEELVNMFARNVNRPAGV